MVFLDLNGAISIELTTKGVDTSTLTVSIEGDYEGVLTLILRICFVRTVLLTVPNTLKVLDSGNFRMSDRLAVVEVGTTTYSTDTVLDIVGESLTYNLPAVYAHRSACTGCLGKLVAGLGELFFTSHTSTCLTTSNEPVVVTFSKNIIILFVVTNRALCMIVTILSTSS